MSQASYYLEKLDQTIDEISLKVNENDLIDNPIFQDESMLSEYRDTFKPLSDNQVSDRTSIISIVFTSKSCKILEDYYNNVELSSIDDDYEDEEESSSGKFIDSNNNNRNTFGETKKSNTNVNENSVDSKKTKYEIAQNKLLFQLLILLDFAIYTSKIESLKWLPMDTFNHVMMQSSIDFITNKFGYVVIVKDSNSSRRLNLTDNNTLDGKRKPGSSLLQIGNCILPKLLQNIKEHEIFAAKLRLFMIDSFAINDKVLLNKEWSVNNYNEFYTRDLKNSSKWPKSYNSVNNNNGRNPRIRLTIDNIYPEYLKLMGYFTDLSETLKDINKAPPTSRGVTSLCKSLDALKNVCSIIFKLDKEQESEIKKKYIQLNNEDYHMSKLKDKTEEEIIIISESYRNKIFECEWILSDEKFRQQTRLFKNRRSILSQCFLVLQFFINCEVDNWGKMIADANKKFETKKSLVNTNFKFPVMLTNKNVAIYLKDLQTDIINHYREYDLEYAEILEYIGMVCEPMWIIWKLRQFVTDDLQLNVIDPGKKRKYDEYIENCQVNKKNYGFNMGTAKLSSIWKIKTGLTNLKQKDARYNLEELLDDYKMDLYRLDSEINNTDGKNPTQLKEWKEERERLNWKAMRVAQRLGYWTKFNQTNEEIGVEGLFDSELYAEFNRRKQEEKAKRREEIKAKEEGKAKKEKENRLMGKEKSSGNSTEDDTVETSETSNEADGKEANVNN
ncbi:unnamed protein product [[Candida] boidinii]|uniref:Unnamed protein product n=1 Tax=Candida boidinii TaxID=5477 RepID=A0A9W6W9B7_CANBO|nr:hypothetical protein B5S30_g957 [[Candida] boidinii]OWB81634.1 hypothetical protein B5S33_g253 [[Candida] boidinii]GME69560.1 unnamed protein product [[Candida] boidinii]GME87896.1 unnamed protein product [[Candida] boidinii]GMG00044.1 unnamed protein product [[Candida] boidinii]